MPCVHERRLQLLQRAERLAHPAGEKPGGLEPSRLQGDHDQGIYGREIFETWYKMLALLENGLDVRGVITHRFTADQYRNGFDAMLSGSSGKVVLDWTF
jgi:threonine 3-dehydrogenase